MIFNSMGTARCWWACVLVVFLAHDTVAVAAPFNQPASQESAASHTGIVPQTNPIVDLELIYEGGKERMTWTNDSFSPYVYREGNGKLEWLLDGVLFIDFLAPSGARLCPITNNKNATRSDWQDLIDHYFQEGQSISVMKKLLESLDAKGHRPLRKRQEKKTKPTPKDDATPWGELDRKKMDFHNS